LTSAERTTQAGANLVHYLHTFVWPHPLAPIMPRSSAAKNFAPTICLAVVAFVLAWFAWRGCSGPLLAAAFATAMLGPTLGFAPFQFQCHADVADHFAYFPILGLSVFVAGACGWLERRGWTAGVRMANVVLLGGLLAVSSAYSRVFADPEVVWRHTLAVNPKAWSAAINLGSYLLERGRDSEAAAVLEQGLAVRPEAPDLHVNLGLAYAKLARHADAERHIRQALALGQERADLWRGLGNASAQQQKWPEAERAFRRALKLSPEDSAARFGLAAVLATVGRKAEALRELDLLLQTDPNHADARAARKRLQALK
jgi:tetratricopeptide (TPR) repeat protein